MRTSYRFYILVLSSFFCLNTSVCSQTIQGTIDYHVFPRSEQQALTELYITIQSESLQFKSFTEGAKASVLITTVITNEEGKMFHAEKIQLQSPVQNDSLPRVPALYEQKQVMLPYGKYQLDIRMKDEFAVDSGISAQVKLNVNVPDTGVYFSDVELITSYSQMSESGPRVKNNYLLEHRVSNFFPKEISNLKFYTELYHTEKVLGSGEPFVLFYKFVNADNGYTLYKEQSFTKHKSAEVVPILADMIIERVPAGNYYLVIELRDKLNQPKARTRKYFQRSNYKEVNEEAKKRQEMEMPESIAGTFVENMPDTLLNRMLKAIRPTSTEQEINMAKALVKESTADQKRSYLLFFWRKRNPEQPEQAYKDYVQRLKTAEAKYATRTFRAYETDRGRVFLQYGIPNRIENEITDFARTASRNSNPIPLEIWSYYNIPQEITHIAQTNRVFVFLEDNRGNNAWRLVHSDAIGELNNPNWRENLPRTYMNVDELPGSTDRINPR